MLYPVKESVTNLTDNYNPAANFPEYVSYNCINRRCQNLIVIQLQITISVDMFLL